MVDDARRPFFHAVVVSSPDGERIEKQEFDDPVKAMFHIFIEMNDEDRKQVAAIAKYAMDQLHSGVRPGKTQPRIEPLPIESPT